MPRYSPARLQVLRQRSGLTQQALADRLHRASATVARWEAGAITPSAGMLGEIASAIGVEDVGELYDPDDPDDAVAQFTAELAELVAAAPPLSAKQKAQVRALVRGAARPGQSRAGAAEATRPGPIRQHRTSEPRSHATGRSPWILNPLAARGRPQTSRPGRR